RALSGNTLSWAYVFEWPIFAGYAVFMWWKLIHDPRPGSEEPAEENADGDSLTAVASVRTEGAGRQSRSGRLGPEEDRRDESGVDEELASYNRYLAALNASDKKKRW
ncbi:MAG: hypothetical protein ACRDY1_02255, partial [Acidimicrobiales bacterium]